MVKSWFKGVAFPVVVIVLWLKGIDLATTLLSEKNTFLNTLGLILLVTCIVLMVRACVRLVQKLVP